MNRIKDLPILERPREKAFRYGIESLSNAEILALLIGSGVKGHSALEISYEILKENGTIRNVKNLSFSNLKKYKGLNEAKIIKLLGAFELAKRIERGSLESIEFRVDNDYLYRKYRNKIGCSTQEQFVVVVLNKRRKIILEKILYVGTENNIPLSYTEIFKTILANNGSCFYILHNHPGDSVYPSMADEEFTADLEEETKRYSIRFLDHLIITSKGYYSFANDKSYLEKAIPMLNEEL